jgi:hypothetical protein
VNAVAVKNRVLEVDPELEGRVTVEPSAVQGSPHDYVYIYGDENCDPHRPHVIISDAAEYGETGIGVGVHVYEEPNDPEKQKDAADVEEAVQLALSLLGR